MNKDQWLNVAMDLVLGLGYSKIMFCVFIDDLMEHYENGLTPEEAVEIEF